MLWWTCKSWYRFSPLSLRWYIHLQSNPKRTSGAGRAWHAVFPATALTLLVLLFTSPQIQRCCIGFNKIFQRGLDHGDAIHVRPNELCTQSGKFFLKLVVVVVTRSPKMTQCKQGSSWKSKAAPFNHLHSVRVSKQEVSCWLIILHVLKCLLQKRRSRNFSASADLGAVGFHRYLIFQ